MQQQEKQVQFQWDQYIEKQIYHLVVQLDFDFTLISKELSTICRALGQKNVSALDCQIKWTQIHNDRKLTEQNKQTQQQKSRIEKLSQCVGNFQNPVDFMTSYELIKRLPAERRNQDFLKVEVSVVEEKQFNSLKDSVRGTRDQEQRQKEQTLKEQIFLQQLELIAKQEDKESDVPLMFKAKFDIQGRLIIEKTEMNQDEASKLLSQKIDLTKDVAPSTLKPELDDNFSSLFGTKILANVVVEPLKKEVLEDEDNINLKLIEQGDLTLDDAVNQLKQLECLIEDIVEEELPEQPFDVDGFKAQSQSQVQQLLQEKINQVKNNLILNKNKIQIQQEDREEQEDSSEEDDENDNEDDSDSEDDFLESQRYNIKDNKPKKQKKNKKPTKSNQKQQQQTQSRTKNRVHFAVQGKEEQQESEQQDDGVEPLYVQTVPKLDATIKFRDQLILEQKLREEKQREKDLKQIEEIENRLQQSGQKEEKLRREAKQDQINKQVEEIQNKIKLDEERQKQKVLAQIETRLEQYDQDYSTSQSNKIDQKNTDFQHQISMVNLKSFFNKHISYLGQVSGLPKVIQLKIDDINAYEQSRDGITSRYQILIFPFIQNVDYQQEFLSFFLINSNLRNLREDDNVLVNDLPRLHRAGFPFSLISFYIGSFALNMNDPGEEVYLPTYVTKKQQQTQKNIVMFFDTHLGRGHQILQARMENITLKDILTPETIRKIQKENDITANTNLNQFCSSHIKQMSEVSKSFFKLHTMHQWNATNPTQEDYSVLIIREYSEIYQVNKPSTEVQTLDSTIHQVEYSTDTQLVCQVKSSLNFLLIQLQKKNIQIIGLRVVYLDEQNIQDIHHNIEHLQFNPQQPIIIIAVQGNQLTSKLQKMIGSQDPKLAQQTYPNSLNALYHNNKQTSVIYPFQMTTAVKLISFFLAGRILKVTTMEQVKKLDGYEQEQIKYFTSPTKTPTVFMLDQLEVVNHCILVSPYLATHIYSILIKQLQKNGFTFDEILTIPVISFTQHLKQLSLEFPQILDLYTSNNSQKPEKSNMMIIFCKGHSFSQIRRNFLLKYIDYNFMIHPGKKELLLPLCLPEQINSVRQQIEAYQNQSQRTFESQYFTMNTEFTHFLLVITKNQANNEGQFGKLLTYLNHLELLGIFGCRLSAKPIIRLNLYRNLKLSLAMKRKSEPSTFCDRVMDMYQEESYVAFFRVQCGSEKLKDQLLQKIEKDHLFLHTNLQVEEGSILKYGGKAQAQTQNINLIEIVRFLFLDIQKDQITEYAKIFDICDDVTLSNSFIYDIPDSINQQVVKSVVLFDETFIKSLSLGSILKKFENLQFKIETILFGKIPTQLKDLVMNRVSQKLDLTSVHLNDLDKCNLQHQIFIKLSQRINNNRFYTIVVSKQNGIFETKQIVQDLTQKFSLLSNEEVGSDFSKIIQFQLSHGVYSSIDYDASEAECKMLQSHINERIIIPTPSTSLMQDFPQQKLLICLSSEQYVQNHNLYEFIQGIQSTQSKIEELSHFQMTIEQLQQNESLYRAYSDKFNPEHMKLLFSRLPSSTIYLTTIILNISKVLKISDLFGSTTINSKGEWLCLIDGDLIKKKSTEFYITTYSNQQLIEIFRESWFSM